MDNLYFNNLFALGATATRTNDLQMDLCSKSKNWSAPMQQKRDSPRSQPVQIWNKSIQCIEVQRRSRVARVVLGGLGFEAVGPEDESFAAMITTQQLHGLGTEQVVHAER